MFEYLAIITVCQNLSQYCQCGKFLLIFYYDKECGNVPKGDIKIMSENETKLFNMLYENDAPEMALLTAIKVFAAFLEQLAEDPTPPAVYPLESA